MEGRISMTQNLSMLSKISSAGIFSSVSACSSHLSQWITNKEVRGIAGSAADGKGPIEAACEEPEAKTPYKKKGMGWTQIMVLRRKQNR